MREVALVIGEALVDVLDREGAPAVRRPGGSAANVAVALARLGRPTALATCFADDPDGALLADHLGREGVVLAGDARRGERTSVAVATIGRDGAASYRFDVDWRPGPVAPPEGTTPRVVHACSYSAVLPPGAADVLAALDRLRRDATVSYDVNLRSAVTGTGPEVARRVEQVAALSDVVKASDEDLAALYPGVPVEEACRRLRRLGPAAVVLTRGAGGAVAWTPEGVVEAPAAPAEVVDTIGAGDTFAAALLDGLWGSGALGGRLDRVPARVWAAALARATRAAAITVTREGADPPRWREIGGD